MVIAVIGATGVVGRTLLDILEERKFPLKELRLFASKRFEGCDIEFRGVHFPCQTLSPENIRGIDLAFFDLVP